MQFHAIINIDFEIQILLTASPGNSVNIRSAVIWQTSSILSQMTQLYLKLSSNVHERDKCYNESRFFTKFTKV